MGLAASVHDGALIDINAALSVRCGLVTGVTGALVSSHHVDALAILAQVVAQLALIHIFAGRSICAERVSRGTFTLVAPFCVQAGSSLTKQWVSLTLIDVHAVLHHHEATLIALKAFALKAAGRVDTCTVTAQVGRDSALVDICAVPLVGGESESVVAPTPEAADGISAGAVGAQTTENLTLVHIFVEGSARQDVSSVGKAMSSGTDGSVLR